jgi:hypothetical protein
VNEILDVFYSGPDTEPEFMTIPNMDGSWQVQIVGTGTGSYTFTAEIVDPNGPLVTTSNGYTSVGEVDNYTLTYPVQEGDPITVEPASPVGGIAEMPDVAGAHLEGSASDRSRIPVPAGVAAAFAAGVAALGVGGRYARRRWQDARSK